MGGKVGGKGRTMFAANEATFIQAVRNPTKKLTNTEKGRLGNSSELRSKILTQHVHDTPVKTQTNEQQTGAMHRFKK